MRYRLLRKALMDAYPTLFVDEDDVLDHLFFVNGNGFKWVDGELTDGDDTPEKVVQRSRENNQQRYEAEVERNRREGCDTSYMEQLLYDDLHKTPACIRRREKKTRIDQARRYGLEYGVIRNGIVIRSLYPLCEYAKILHVPADVKPDWLAAARKAYEMALSPRWRSRRGDYKRNQKYLRQARDLLATFPKGKAQ